MSALGQAIPEGFKQTDVGTIPEDWKDEQLFELVKVIDGDRGHNYPSANDFSSDGYCVFLSASNVTKKGFSFKDISFINKTKDEALRKGKLKRNDIVLTTRGTVGQYAFYDETIGYEHLRINSGMVLVRVISKEIKPDYLYSVLKSHIVQKQLSTMSFGSAQPQLTVRDINNFIVCYPSGSKEQTAIANALSDVDALLTELEKLIAKKQAIKTATMQQLLTGKTRLPQFATYTEGAVEGKRKGTKPSELGEIPEDWDVLTLDKLINSTQLGGNYSNSETESNYPLIKMGNLGRGKIKLNKLEYVTESVSPRDLLKFGDILFNTRNTLELVGKVAIWKNELPEAYFNSNIMRFSFNEKLVSSNAYINAAMNTKKFVTYLAGIATGTTSVAAIYTRDLLQLKLLIPPKEEQTAIATILSDMDNEIQTLEQRLTKIGQIKQGMMQQLLTGRTRLPY